MTAPHSSASTPPPPSSAPPSASAATVGPPARNRKPARGSRLRRWALRIGLGLLALPFVLVLLIQLVMLLPPTREMLRKQANGALAGLFQGRLVLDRLGAIGFSGVSGVDIVITDPKQARVIVARGVRASIFWPKVAYDAVRGADPLLVPVSHVAADDVTIHLIDDGKGSPTLASTFLPREPTPEDPSGGTVIVDVPDIQVRHIWAHGQFGTAPLIDAEVARLAVGLRVDGRGTHLDLKDSRILTRALPMNVNPAGKLTARVLLPAAENAKPSVRSDFDGTVAGAASRLHARLEGDAVEAWVKADAIPPSTFENLSPEFGVKGPTSLDVKVEGTLPSLRFEGAVLGPFVKARLHGDATIGDATAGQSTTVNAKLEARDLDAQALVPTAPPTALGLDATASVTLGAASQLTGHYEVTLHPGSAAGQTTPGVNVNGELASAGAGALTTQGKLTVQEPGLRLAGTYEVSSGDAGTQASLNAHTTLQNPARLRAFDVRTAGKLDLHASYSQPVSGPGQVKARADGELGATQHPAGSAERVVIAASAEGPTDALMLRAGVNADGVAAQGRKFEHARIFARGTPERLNVSADLEEKGRRTRISSDVATGEALTLAGPRVVLHDAEGDVEVSAREVQVAGSRITVRELALRGAGEANGNVVIAPARQELTLETRDVQLARLARALGVELPVSGGRITLKTKLVRRTYGDVEGRIEGRAREIGIRDVGQADVDIDLVAENRKLTGTASAELGDIGNLAVVFDDVTLPRGELNEKALRETVGAIAAQGKVRLREVTPMLQQMGVPIERASGRVEFTMKAERKPGSPLLPRVEANIVTERLRIVEQRPTRKPVTTAAEARETEPEALEGIDFAVVLDLDPAKQKALASVTAKDQAGPLVIVNADADISGELSKLVANYQRVPLKVGIEVPRRSLEQLPRSVRPSAMRGYAQLNARVEGSIADPKLVARAEFDSLRTPQTKQPLGVLANLSADRRGGELSANGTVAQSQVLEVVGKWQGDVTTVPAALTAEHSPVKANLAVRLNAFPVDVVPALQDREIHGHLDGNVRLTGFGQNAAVNARIEGRGFRIGNVPLTKMRVELTTAGEDVRGRVEAGTSGGDAVAQVGTRLTWGARVVPIPSEKLEARLTAHDFQLESISPLVREQLSELAGKLDADVRVDLDAGKTVVAGGAELTNGAFQVPQVGQRFSRVNAKLAVSEREFRLEQFEAHGTSGKLTAKAKAALQGINLLGAEGEVNIAEDDKLPLTLEGAAIGDAWGRIVARYRPSPAPGQASQVTVDVPEFHIMLPEQGSQSLQPLDDAEDIRIGVHSTEGKFLTLPVQPLESTGGDATASGEPPTPLEVQVKLGRNVTVQQERMVKVQLTGDVGMRSAGEETRVTGRISLVSGTLDVQGKRFEIERGLVTFDGPDPSNPTVTATARWDAPGYSVYAEYSGDVKNGKLSLRSEPPLTQDEIASLLMFGAPDGNVGSSGGGGGTAAMAVGVAGDTAARGLNQALSDFTNLDVSARIDTSTGSSRPELVFQITPRLSARVTRAIGDPSFGEPPDRTFLTVELRIKRAISLATMLGDRGATALDLIWRKRY